MKPKIMIVFGTRPEAIKMAPLYRHLKHKSDKFDVRLCSTGQHREMLNQVLELFDILPDINLNVMKPSHDLFDVTSAVLTGMRDAIKSYQPDLLLVHGDTTTTLAASLAGFYLGVDIGHVEAGLRTHNLQHPFPEEFNRQTCSTISKWHFAPTKLSQENLCNENINDEQIIVTGNTVIDALFWVLEHIETTPKKAQLLTDQINASLPFDWKQEKYILITGHRRENFGEGFINICEAIKSLAQKYKNIHFIYPVHLNPNVQTPVNALLNDIPNIHLIAPLDYEPFIYLLKHSHIVLTDSGGIQEEAPSLGKPVLVMRDTTERPEAVQAGTVKLVGTDKEKIIQSVCSLIDDETQYKIMSQAINPYGDGKAVKRIVAFLEAHYSA